MVKSEYTVIGDWAIRNADGDVRHKVCRRWCHDYNYGINTFHRCSADELEELENPEPEDPYELNRPGFNIEIPAFVVLISKALRRS